ncbi:zinc-finger homeodomain protein 6 [Dorcoceras hygrometricum]|uniref:Zinc-finger homeodomain protein 6 n=1 Tax=Dorcoceras hygrometricum TaxID=472368 RepID=A0A2Z7BM34_9LAMI|nr:zinc-finger homeodomain protein 6 [Dorcoceras hygrometricum]
MERRGQARDMLGIQGSMNYNIPPPTSQGSPVKLPLAPLVATSADRRGNATVSTRRGSSIFSPTQILDNHNHPPPHLRHQVSTPPPQPTPDPDPAPSAAAAAGESSNLKASATQPQVSPPPAAAADCSDTSSSIIYRECLKNHAAGIGGHVVDGCGEFMASGEEGTPEAVRCAACDCHRSFHRKEVKGEPPQQPYIHYPCNPNHNTGNSNIHRPNPLLHTLNTPRGGHLQNLHHKHSTQPTMVNFGGSTGGAAAESSSEDLNMFHSGSGGHASTQPSISGSKKRFRTKFSQEQKDRMHEFAERLEWRIQKQDDQQVQQFCSEIGVRRQVFKVWMHNNKQAMKKKQI